MSGFDQEAQKGSLARFYWVPRFLKLPGDRGKGCSLSQVGFMLEGGWGFWGECPKLVKGAW